ncbi:MAG: hypothetical protein FD170_3887 [Bacteroidetes bacterium]|nr:MAG: hypothetical protein FD170_3887 [Bacteroidota bacterium]
MSNVILHKRSSIPSGRPALSLPLGELAVNTADGVLFTKKNAGSDVMVEFHGSETPHLFRHQGTVSNPAAGYVKLYPKSDNNFYKRTSAGVEAKLWDSANHGTGSGLDADLLDGQHASAFSVAGHNHTIDGLSNTMITNNTIGELLKWNGTFWINNTLAEAGIEPAFTKNTGFNKNFGTAAGTVAEGNHTHAYAPTSHTHDDRYYTETESDARYSALGHTHSYQPLDADLTAIAALTGVTGMLKKTAENAWEIDGNSYAYTYHSHESYVEKAGDTMTGNLVISKGGSPSTAHYRLATTYAANYATQAWFEASSYSNGGYALIKAIHTDAGVPTEYNLISAGFPTVKTLYIGDNNFGAVFFRVPNGIVGNISHVICSGIDGITYRVPVGDIGGGGGSYLPLSGGQLSGNLEIRKAGATFDIKSNLLGYVSGTDITDLVTRVIADSGTSVYEYNIIRTDAVSTRTYKLLNTMFRDGRDVVLNIGGTYFDDTALYAKTDVIGNITHVYTANVDGITKLVPVGSFGGGGGLTSVGLSMPNIFSVANSPLTANGTLAVSLVSQAQRLFLASPVSASGVPSFRALHANDLPDLSGIYDYYGAWQIQVDSAATKLIQKPGAPVENNFCNGLKFIGGTNVTLSEAIVSGVHQVTIAAAGGGGLSYSGMALNQSPAPISANTWTDIPVAQYTTWGAGNYLIMGTIQVTKSTTGAGLVAARIIMSNGTVIASAEYYHYTTTSNRMHFSLFGIYQMGGGAAVTAKLQIWSNQTGWSALANTPTTNSIGATKIEVIKIT